MLTVGKKERAGYWFLSLAIQNGQFCGVRTFDLANSYSQSWLNMPHYSLP
jgi:hypothetical protein